MSIQDMTTKPALPKRPTDPQLDKDSNLISKLLAATPLYLYHGSVVPPGFFSGMLRQLSSSLAAADQKNTYGVGSAEQAGNPQLACPRVSVPYSPFSHSNPLTASATPASTNRKFDIRSLVQTDTDPIENSRKRHAEATVSPVPKRPRTEAPALFPTPHPMQSYFDALRNQNNVSDVQLRFLQQQLHLSSLYQNSLLAQHNIMQNIDPAMALLQQHSEAWRRHQHPATHQPAPMGKDALDLTGQISRQENPKKSDETETKENEENNESDDKER